MWDVLPFPEERQQEAARCVSSELGTMAEALKVRSSSFLYGAVRTLWEGTAGPVCWPLSTDWSCLSER